MDILRAPLDRVEVLLLFLVAHRVDLRLHLPQPFFALLGVVDDPARALSVQVVQYALLLLGRQVLDFLLHHTLGHGGRAEAEGLDHALTVVFWFFEKWMLANVERYAVRTF